MTEIKKIKGRKRHVIVDTMGNLLSVFIHAANIHDTKSGIFGTFSLLKISYNSEILRRCRYRGTFIDDVEIILGRCVDIAEKIKPHEWEKLKCRWVVERTFSWFNAHRRLSKDYEINEASSALMVMLSHIHTLLSRLLKQLLIIIFYS